MIEFAVQLLTLAVSLVVLAAASHFTIKSMEKLIELTGLSETSAGFVILAVRELCYDIRHIYILHSTLYKIGTTS